MAMTSLTRVAYSCTPNLHRLLPAARTFSARAGTSPIRVGFDSESDSEAERTPTPIQKLEEAVHRVVVRRSQPDWLPFRPGASYWVPPKTQARGYADAMTKLANSVSSNADPSMVFASARGWPSSDCFLQDVAPSTREVETISNHKNKSEEEEEEEG